MQTIAFVALLALAAGPQSTQTSCACAHCQHQAQSARTATTQTTASFIVRSHSTGVDADTLGQHAEAMRKSLAALWLGEKKSESSWTPRCEIVVHAQRASYLKATGAAGVATSGSTLVRFNQGKVVSRRIDLLADRASRPFETIAHELVHAIFAERFPGAAPPRWAEEGAALLADTQTKRAAHERDFKQALRNGTAFRVEDLVRMNDYPPPTRFAAFYGQSLVLVDFLTKLGEPGDFVRFVDRSIAVGHHEALRDVYGISSPERLQELWSERTAVVILAAN
jgi:hypothetical protein